MVDDAVMPGFLARGPSRPLPFAAAALVLVLSSSPALGNEEVGELLEEAAVPVSPESRFVFEDGFSWQGQSDIDAGGDLQVFRYDLGAGVRTQLTDSLRWNNFLFFGVGDYDFGGGGFGSADPWDTILNLRLGTRLGYAFDEHWGISGGGLLIFTPEAGAEWGDSTTGGGTLGAEYRSGDTFFVSLGIAVISQIEDDATVAPAVALSWLPHPQWAIRLGAIPASGGSATAAEVAYRVIEPLELGFGLLYHERRFRLDDSGVAPGGVGEDNSLPLRLRVGFDVHPNITLHAVVGAVLAGELELENRNGVQVAKSDYDPAPYIGVRMSGRF
jgi:hypothetical protein